MHRMLAQQTFQDAVDVQTALRYLMAVELVVKHYFITRF
jgi:hypothetical protein